MTDPSTQSTDPFELHEDGHLNSVVNHHFVELLLNNASKGGGFKTCAGRKKLQDASLKRAFSPEVVPEFAFMSEGIIHFVSYHDGDYVDVEIVDDPSAIGNQDVLNSLMAYAKSADKYFGTSIYDSVWNPRPTNKRARKSLPPVPSQTKASKRGPKSRPGVLEVRKRDTDKPERVLPFQVVDVFEDAGEVAMVGPIKDRGPAVVPSITKDVRRIWHLPTKREQKGFILYDPFVESDGGVQENLILLKVGQKVNALVHAVYLTISYELN